MLFSPPLFSSWCSSSLPSLCPLFLYFYGFLPLLWSLSLSLLCLLCFCLFFFVSPVFVPFLPLVSWFSLCLLRPLFSFFMLPPCLRLRPPVLPSCSRFSPLGSALFFPPRFCPFPPPPSSVNLCSEDEGEAGVRWFFLCLFFPCFCFVCFSLSPAGSLPLPFSVAFCGFYKAREWIFFTCSCLMIVRHERLCFFEKKQGQKICSPLSCSFPCPFPVLLPVFFLLFFSLVTFRSLAFIAIEQCRFLQPLIAGVMVAVGIRWRRWTAHPHRRRRFGVNGYLHFDPWSVKSFVIKLLVKL